jgi:hypothetical protein
MSYHSVSRIEKLEQQLRDRFEKLLSVMQGRELTKAEISISNYQKTPHRFITSDDIRVAVDDFATIHKEIKATLGKR